MDVVRQGLTLVQPPLVHLCRLLEKFNQTARQFSAQYSSAILWDPAQVVYQTMFRMRAGPKLWLVAAHIASLPQAASARHVFSRDSLQAGLHPQAKAWGFRPRGINT